MFSLLEIIAPVAGLAINVVVQVLSYRYLKSIIGLFKSLVLAFLLGLAGVLVLGFFNLFSCAPRSLEDNIAILLMNVIAYASLSYCYFNFINLGETARRIRIVREIYEAGDTGLSAGEIIERYGAKQIVEIRLLRLLKKNQILYRTNRYYIGNTSMLFIARTMIFLKFLLLGKKSEFD